MENFDLTQIIAYGTIAVGALAFLVGVITEVIKGVSIFNKIPTDILVFALSIILTVVAVFVIAPYVGIIITWQIVVASVVVSFIVAFLSMFGWSKLSDLWKKFNPKDNTGN